MRRLLNERTERDYAAAYLKGVHNTDAAAIYLGLKKLQAALGILQFSPVVRVAAQLFWFDWRKRHATSFSN